MACDVFELQISSPFVESLETFILATALIFVLMSIGSNHTTRKSVTFGNNTPLAETNVCDKRRAKKDVPHASYHDSSLSFRRDVASLHLSYPSRGGL